MNISAFFKKNWIHFAAIGIFLVICLTYFRLELTDYQLKQHDIEQHVGMSHEIVDFREHNNGQEPLWTNSMFGGMPATQVSLIHGGNWFSNLETMYFKTLPSPLGIVLLYIIGFYIMLSMMKINKWVAIVGALTYGFLSYQIIILGAGHNSKGVAIAFLAPVVGSFFYAYRRSWKWGALLSALFMSFELAANHLQVTYYLSFVLLALGIAEVFRVLKSKEYKNFLKATLGILVGYFIAVSINYGNVSMTNDYVKHSIRGGNDLSIDASGESNSKNSTEGLERTYVTEYSYGLGETFSFITPYAKGAGTMTFEESPFVDLVEKSDYDVNMQDAILKGGYAYWGDQPATSGPVYIGVIVVFLALLGMVYIKDASKWALLAVTILTVMLSWGKNYMGLTDWFLDNVPGYNKFRAVTIILVIAELCIPLLAVLLVDKLIKEREAIKANLKPFYVTSASYFLLLLVLKFGGIDDSYTWIREREAENQPAPDFEAMRGEFRNQIMSMPVDSAAKFGIDATNPQSVESAITQQIEMKKEEYKRNEESQQLVKNAVKDIREQVWNSSMTRSILFTLLAIGCLALYFLTSVSAAISLGALGLIAFLDIITMSSNYMNNSDLPDGSGYKYWVPILEAKYPTTADQADMDILTLETEANSYVDEQVKKGFAEGKAKAYELDASGSDARRIEMAYGFSALNRNTNYRVFDQQGGFSSAAASYFHKSLGGYHGAKLRSIQNLAEFHLYKSNQKVYDMLNVKYFLSTGAEGRTANPNPTALGNAWFVRNAKVVSTADQEILSLGSKFKMSNISNGRFFVNGVEKKQLESYANAKLQYLPAGARDTLSIQLSNDVPKGAEIVYVKDTKGKTNLIMKRDFDRDTTKSFTAFVDIKSISEFKPIEEIIVSATEAKKLKAKSWKGEGIIKLKSYAPNKLVYTTNASDKGMAVFSEVYYADGWTATINGKPADIVRVNYLLRGLELPKGESKIVFTYKSEKFEKMNTISSLMSLLLILLIAAAGFMYWRESKKKVA